MADDIVDQIDQLVDDQMADGERAGKHVWCHHCGRAWHGLPLTERVIAMYDFGVCDESYRVDTDTSRVICQGSDFIGPMPAHPALPLAPGSMERARQEVISHFQHMMDEIDRQLEDDLAISRVKYIKALRTNIAMWWLVVTLNTAVVAFNLVMQSYMFIWLNTLCVVWGIWQARKQQRKRKEEIAKQQEREAD